jgi:hypothetical protein
LICLIDFNACYDVSNKNYPKLRVRDGEMRRVCKISGFHHGEYEERHLLGYYAV